VETWGSKGLHLPYRKDIDGLRAVAVILVVIFHAFPAALTGGYVGVDVFFVISGYVIDLLPNLPSFISRVRSVFGPCWGGLQIRSA
jgi:hypothetical protein